MRFVLALLLALIGPVQAQTVTTGVVASVNQIGGVDQTTAWTAYTPTFACATGTLTTAAAVGRYKQLGKSLTFALELTITTNGTCATRIDISAPFASSNAEPLVHYVLAGYESQLTGKVVSGYLPTGSTSIQMRFYDGTYPGGTGNVIRLTGTYELP